MEYLIQIRAPERVASSCVLRNTQVKICIKREKYMTINIKGGRQMDWMDFGSNYNI